MKKNNSLTAMVFGLAFGCPFGDSSKCPIAEMAGIRGETSPEKKLGMVKEIPPERLAEIISIHKNHLAGLEQYRLMFLQR